MKNDRVKKLFSASLFLVFVGGLLLVLYDPSILSNLQPGAAVGGTLSANASTGEVQASFEVQGVAGNQAVEITGYFFMLIGFIVLVLAVVYWASHRKTHRKSKQK